MNGNIQFIGLVMLACIVIIVAIYYFRDVNNKHTKILEKYEETKEALINNTKYGTTHDGNYNADDLKKYSDRNIKLRDCQVYFTDESVCDEDDSENKTCKYVFNDGWKEIDEISYPTGDTPPNTIKNKIYNQSYTRKEADIPNHKEMTTCFKKINNETDDNRFLYKNNDLVKYGYGGVGQKIGLNVYDEQSGNYISGNYISMYFDNNNDVPSTNYTNTIDSICSLKRDTIPSLRNITTNSVNPYFYKFGIDKNNNVNVIRISKWINRGSQRPLQGKEIINDTLSTALTKKTKFTIDELQSFNLEPPSMNDFILSRGNYFVITKEKVLDITLVELNSEQNAFISHGIADFVQSSAVGIEYLNTTQGKINFNVFKQSSLPDMNVEIYQFKYNYLCNNNVLEYLNQVNTTISLNSFIVTSDNVEDGKKLWSIKSYELITTTFWNNYTEKTPRQDQKFNIIADLRKIMKTESDKLDNSSNAKTIITLTETKIKWGELKTIADTAKNSFYLKTFTELMNVTKDAFTDVEGNYSSNSTIKPFNYDLGYYIYRENPEGPFVPSEQYGSKSLNETSFSYTTTRGFSMGSPGLSGFKNTGINFRGDKNRIKRHNVSPTKSNITNFVDISTMGDNRVDGDDLYSWYWKGYFYAHVKGYYYFQTNSDDASFVWINGNMVVNNGGDHSMRRITSGPQWFNQGEYKEIEITFSENRGGDNINFKYFIPNTGWYNYATYNNGLTYIYDNIVSAINTPVVKPIVWTFRDGTYYAQIDSQVQDIQIDTMKINNKDFTIKKEGGQNPDKWNQIVFQQDADELYMFYIQEKSDTKMVYLKAVDKPETVLEKTEYMVFDNNDKFYINTFLDKDLWWNRSIKTEGDNSIHPYLLSRITITSFIYLQKGFYKFNHSMAIPLVLEVTDAILSIPQITNVGNGYYRVDTGGFYMFMYSNYVLNNSDNIVTPVLTITADFKSLDNSFVKNGIDMTPYIYGGKKLYTDFNKSWFNDMFDDIKVFQPNTSEDFNKIKEFLTPTDRGNDFWNLTSINKKITDIDTTLRSSNELLAASKKGLEDTYNSTINSIDGLDYENEFMKNNAYFDNPAIQYKSNVNITSIFANMGTRDVGIASYITYEKIADPTGRTANNRADNFNIVNTANKSIYLLKSSINTV